MAIQVVAGEPLRTYITYIHPDDTPILGATFSVVSALRSDGTSFAGNVLVTERANGVYDVTAPTSITDPPGEYHLVVSADLDGSIFQEIFDMSSTRPPVVVEQAITTGGISRRDLRRMVARELGDLIMVEATSDGTESTIIDEHNLTLENRHYNGMEIRCTQAMAVQNLGRTGTVTVSDQATRSINFIPPLALPTMVGDEFELTNFRGTGWHGFEYDAAINAAIRRAGDEHYGLRASVVSDQPFNRQTGTVAVPQQFTYFHGATWSRRSGEFRKLLPGDYDLDRYSHTLHIKRYAASKMNGAYVTVMGEIEPPPLEDDNHKTPIPVDWIVTEVKAILQNKSVSQGSGQNRDRLFYMDRQGADARRTLIIPSRPPNCVKLR